LYVQVARIGWLYYHKCPLILITYQSINVLVGEANRIFTQVLDVGNATWNVLSRTIDGRCHPHQQLQTYHPRLHI